MPQLEYEYKIQRNIGVIEHHHNKILLKEKYDKINNELNIDDIIKFIGESNIIITNTYHALYFSALLGDILRLFNILLNSLILLIFLVKTSALLV